jgi:tetratricopeptide (TPR) repeat protein
MAMDVISITEDGKVYITRKEPNDFIDESTLFFSDHKGVYSFPRDTKFKKVCTPNGPPPKTLKIKHRIDFTESTIRPFPHGTSQKDKPRHRIPRSNNFFKEAFKTKTSDLRQCYRWSRYYNPTLEGHLSVAMDVDMWGVVDNIVVKPIIPDGEQLAVCVSDVLQDLYINQISPQKTKAFVMIYFKGSLGRPPLMPKRPAPTKKTQTAPNNTCLYVPDKIDEYKFVPKNAIIEIDDYDKNQVAAEEDGKYQHALYQSRSKGKISSRTRVKIVKGITRVSCCGSEEIQTYFTGMRHNIGSFRACYSNSLKTNKNLSGKVDIKLEVDLAGNTRNVVVTSIDIKDNNLLACLRNAVEQTWFDPHYQFIAELSIPLLLNPKTESTSQTKGQPSAVEAIKTKAKNLLTQGNASAAIEQYNLLIEKYPKHQDRCLWHVALLEANLKLAPWVDERSEEAVLELYKHMKLTKYESYEEKRKKQNSCLDKALPFLRQMVVTPLKLADTTKNYDYYNIASVRYRMFDKLFKNYWKSFRLLYYIGIAENKLGNLKKANSIFLDLATDCLSSN